MKIVFNRCRKCKGRDSLKIEELGMEEYFIGGHPMVGSEKAGFLSVLTD